MNSFDGFLKFTCEKMEKEELPFLDTTVYLDAQKVPQIKFYRKPTASDVKLNFKKSVTPKKYLISTLTGEIYRVVRCTSTENDKEAALEDLKDLFLKNQYPESLVSSKIRELRERNFEPLGDRDLKQKERRDNMDRFYDFSIPFTSSRCEKILKRTVKMLKNITPNYQLNLTWTTIKLRNSITFR